MAKTLEQILAEQKPNVVAKAQMKTEEILFNIHLAELRGRLQKTQVDVAQILDIKVKCMVVPNDDYIDYH
ncbi:hypothetical protein [Legionella sp.]|uniref:hypothetical protein n=1 Tax=Legionella sp. TaxID=459 RepID=UPI003CB076EC